MPITEAQINELRARVLVINRYLAGLNGDSHPEGWVVLADQLRAAAALAIALARLGRSGGDRAGDWP